jgi:hypothetical protein
MQVCSESPQSAYDVLPVLFKRPLDVHQSTFALGEAVAHLNLLWWSGQLQRVHSADGIYRFSTLPTEQVP